MKHQNKNDSLVIKKSLISKKSEIITEITSPLTGYFSVYVINKEINN